MPYPNDNCDCECACTCSTNDLDTPEACATEVCDETIGTDCIIYNGPDFCEEVGILTGDTMSEVFAALGVVLCNSLIAGTVIIDTVTAIASPDTLPHAILTEDVLSTVQNRIYDIEFQLVPGADGADGADGAAGADGADGTNGTDGVDGTDGVSSAFGAWTTLTLVNGWTVYGGRTPQYCKNDAGFTILRGTVTQTFEEEPDGPGEVDITGQVITKLPLLHRPDVISVRCPIQWENVNAGDLFNYNNKQSTIEIQTNGEVQIMRICGVYGMGGDFTVILDLAGVQFRAEPIA